MTTLRRNLIQETKKILNEYMASGYSYLGEEIPDELVERLADAALEIIQAKPKIDLARTDPAWAILSGKSQEITQEEFDDLKVVGDALNTFERDMQLPGNWQWYAARGSEDKAWKLLRDFVVAKYKEDPKAFEKYQTWRTQPYARGAMSNLAIKRNPENFPASWTDFLASTNGSKKPVSRPVEKDDNDIPFSY